MFLVPAVLQKHILSDSFVVPAKRRWPQNISCPPASVIVRPLLVISQYLSTAFVVGDLSGKNVRLYGLIKRVPDGSIPSSLREASQLYGTRLRGVAVSDHQSWVFLEQSCE